MKLTILRHAIAEKRDSRRYETDGDRPLTKEGKEKMVKIAQGMLRLGLTFDAVLSSPYVRARETAEIVLEIFKKPEEIDFTKNLQPEGNWKKLLRELDHRYEKCQNVLLVGHEPYLSDLISRLLCGHGDIPINFKKGGLCQLKLGSRFRIQDATLNWLLTPRQLRALAK